MENNGRPISLRYGSFVPNTFQRSCLESESESEFYVTTDGQWPFCLGIKHPSGDYDQIFITVRQLRVC
jgi:hypothetical protein